MSESDDVRDVRTVRSGHVGAFVGIVNRWQGPLVTLAYRFCRDQHRAEDMAQEALLTIHRKLDHWSGDGPFRSWAFAVATNVYRSELRRHPITPERLVEEPASPTRQSNSAEADLIRRLVATLPARYRDALVLFYFHDCDLAETASQLELPTGTVKARLSRGRKLLEQALVERES